MDNLSIVIRDTENNIYKHLEDLKPLLEDDKIQLILINNEIDRFDIPYEYTHYEFHESYDKFMDFYESICLYDNKLLVEKGIQIDTKFTEKVMQCIQNNKNLKAKIRKFINHSKTEYIMDNFMLILNDNSNEVETLNNVILEDYSMIFFDIEDIEVNLYKLLKEKLYEEIYYWYNTCIKQEDKIYEQRFFEILEYLKLILEIKQDKISEMFLSNDVNERYKNYLTIMSLYQEKKDGFIEKIKSLLLINDFQEDDIYFSNFIKKLFNDKNYCLEILSYINIDCLNCYIKYILENNENFYIDIYNFMISVDLGKETSIKNNDRISLILNILKSYISYMEDKSADIKKKNILIQMFLDYTNYGFYNLNKNLGINKDLNLNDETKFLIEMDRVADCLNKNLIDEAISILRNTAEEYIPMTMAVRYYIQKLIRDNNLYKYKLSICMMAKNEEKFLNKCLNSIKPLLDSGMAELIFVDTGSTDSTIKIASNYVNKIYHKLWEGNFSKMRNYCISLAQGEYIFILDADEELEKGEAEKLIELFNSEEYKQYNSYTFKEKNFNDEEYKNYSLLTRNALFKNREDFYYYGSVHNQPNKVAPVNDLDTILLHYGYIMTEDIKDKKFERTAKLLKNELQKTPNNLYYRMQLSTSYSMHGDHKKALEQVELYMKLIKDKELTKGLSIMACSNAVVIYSSNGLYEKVIEICARALEVEPTFIDFLYNKALACFALEQYSESINNYQQYLYLINNTEKLSIFNDDRYILYSLDSKNEALGKLLICYYKIKDNDNFNKVVDEINDDTLLKYCIYTILKFYIENKMYSDLMQFFSNKIMISDNSDIKFVFNYFISEIIDECNDKEKQNIVMQFNNINKSNEYLETIKALLNSSRHGATILDFINRYNLEKLDLVTAKMVLDKTYPLLIKNDSINNVTLEQIKALKDSALFILNNTVNTKLFKGISKESLITITQNYIRFCNKLIDEEKHNLLNKKEIEFCKIIKLAKVDFNNNDLTLGLRKVRDAVVVHGEMARPMQLYLETVIEGYKADLEYFNNSNGEEKMNNEFLEYSKKIRSQIEQMINNNSLDDAELLIKQYKEIVNNDIEIYSMEAILYIMKGNLEKAEQLIREGLKIDSKKFDLLYNLAYLYELKQKFNDAIKIYLKAKDNCTDKSLCTDIENAILRIQKEYDIMPQPTRKRIAFFVKQGLDSFLDDIINGLSGEYETKKIIVTNYNQIDEGMEWADICWFEWCDELIGYGSGIKSAKEKKIICRIHGYEVYSQYIRNVKWEHVNRLIIVAPHIKRLFEMNTTDINKGNMKIDLIFCGVALDKYPLSIKDNGYNLGYLGLINHKKNIPLTLDIFKKLHDMDSRYKLYLAGKFQDTRLHSYISYFINENNLTNSVIYDGWLNQREKVEWFKKINYIVISSIDEGLCYAAAEAMSCGTKPILHNCEGIKDHYDNKYIYNSLDEAVDMITSDNYCSEEYREFIANNYALNDKIIEIKNIIKEIQ